VIFFSKLLYEGKQIRSTLNTLLKACLSWALVSHDCNPSYSGGRDEKNHGLKPAWANCLQDPILKKNPSQKWAGGVAQGVGPELKTQYCPTPPKQKVKSLFK
jgi:hypothetical protein